MSILVTSDLHLTDRDRDEYRWGLFPWLEKQIRLHNVGTLLFLGDTTDAKDRHSAKLTNRIVDIFTNLAYAVNNFYILRGNHDYIDENTPFFKFLNHIENLFFIVERRIIDLDNDKIGLLIPNTLNFVTRGIRNIDYIFCHQTFNGARAENGEALKGLDPAMFDKWKGTVISGDVHVPQTIHNDKIIYVGSPYAVRFGDKFLPRVILLDETTGNIQSLYYQTVRKHTLTISKPSELKSLDVQKGDQIKIRLSLSDIILWEDYKDEIIEFCKAKEVDLHGIEFLKKDTGMSLSAQKAKLKSLSPQEIFTAYCKSAKVGEDVIEYGEKILNEQVTK